MKRKYSVIVGGCLFCIFVLLTYNSIHTGTNIENIENDADMSSDNIDIFAHEPQFPEQGNIVPSQGSNDRSGGIAISKKLVSVQTINNQNVDILDSKNKAVIDSIKQPNFEIYLRYTTARKSFVTEAESWMLYSFQIFWPKNTNLIVALDDDVPSDHAYGSKLAEKFPKLKLKECYTKAYYNKFTHGWGKARTYLDMLHADDCTQAEYVGFTDVDTLFVTAVTQNLLFEAGKPIVTGRIGYPSVKCWIQTGAYILGVKQVVQCMHYFPVLFKVSHLKQLRKYVEKLHDKPFLQVFQEAPDKLGVHWSCYCHYSVMCNYVWYHHHDEYSWHLQLTMNGHYDGRDQIDAMVDKNYFQNNIKQNEKVPVVRSSVHMRHYWEKRSGQMKFISPEKHVVAGLIKEGLCYSYGIKYCPNLCKEYNKSKLQESIFNFEVYDWTWDSRCAAKQDEHYKNIENILSSRPFEYRFGNTIEEMCKFISERYNL